MTLAAVDAFDSAMRNWGANLSWPAESVLRLLLAAVAGGLVGIEREVRGRQAGFRTNILVAVGSALIMLVSIAFAHRTWPHDSSFNLNVDPARIAYGIMTGIGFIGAGVIIKHGASVRGLTTAAALWCVAAVGMAAGFGMYTLTFCAAVLIVLALWLLDYLENMLPKVRYRVLVVRRPWAVGCVNDTIQRLRDAGVKVNDATFHRLDPDLSVAQISVQVEFMGRHKFLELEKVLENTPMQYVATREE